MDDKKKRNKKKKGNQGKNTGDVTSNAGEAAPQCHNHESAPKDHHDGADADDAMSSVGGAPQYQNRKPTPQANYSGANADDTVSSVEEGIPCYENHEPTMTQENHKVSNKVHADQRSVGMSESSVELDMHRLYEGKLGKLHETINQLQDEKSSRLQKVSMIESELENLRNKVGYHAQNEILLEEKLNNLQNGCNVLVKKEEILDNKVRCIEDINEALTHGETYLEERLCGLEETNKALQVQVLDETSKNTIEENERLVKSLDELESRLQALEGKAFLTEASMKKEVPENPVMDRKDLIGSLLHKQSTGFTDMTSEGNGLIADRGLSSSVTVTSENNYSHINNSPSNAHASNYLDETSVQLLGKASSTSAAEGLIHVNAHQVSKQGFDEPRMSEEIVPVPLDDIQIHEDDPQPSEADKETAEVPFSDAPIVGAPFRLISFVARYVSGADLVNQK